jgi:membrane-bound ClpP family serine protease
MLDVGRRRCCGAIRSAHSEGHDVLVIEIDTPGGELDLMSRYVRMIGMRPAAGS